LTRTCVVGTTVSVPTECLDEFAKAAAPSKQTSRERTSFKAGEAFDAPFPFPEVPSQALQLLLVLRLLWEAGRERVDAAITTLMRDVYLHGLGMQVYAVFTARGRITVQRILFAQLVATEAGAREWRGADEDPRHCVFHEYLEANKRVAASGYPLRTAALQLGVVLGLMRLPDQSVYNRRRRVGSFTADMRLRKN
ncbi:hypothetical protein CYMTET_42386, partial [Cymbomonas tetramitiformis]